MFEEIETTQYITFGFLTFCITILPYLFGLFGEIEITEEIAYEKKRSTITNIVAWSILFFSGGFNLITIGKDGFFSFVFFIASGLLLFGTILRIGMRHRNRKSILNKDT